MGRVRQHYEAPHNRGSLRRSAGTGITTACRQIFSASRQIFSASRQHVHQSACVFTDLVLKIRSSREM